MDPGEPHEPPRIYIPADLYEGTRDFFGFINGSEFLQIDCEHVLSQVYDGLFGTPARIYDQTILREKWQEVIGYLYKSRFSLRRKLGQWLQDGPVSAGCVNRIRDVIRASRHMEDFIGGWRMNLGAPNPDRPMPAFTGEAPHVLRSPGHDSFDFRRDLRSGDVLLSRGDAFTSAAIARLADGDSHFSHLAIVYVNPRDGKTYVVESHIEIGVAITPLDQYVADGKVRAVVLRHREEELATRAGEWAYTQAKAAIDRGDPIHYDFTMQMDDNTAMFCSELIRAAYKNASNGSVMVPLYPSTFRTAHPPFLARLGVTASVSFMPGDIEVDPRFVMIAEWRDYSRMPQTHLRDAVLVAMYTWMREQNYLFHGNLASAATETVVWRARRWRLFSGMLRDRFPPYMPRETLGTFVLFEQVAGSIFASLERKDQKYFREHNLHMTPKDLARELERIRALDAQRYRWHKAWRRARLGVEPDRPDFHEIFRP